MVTSPVSLGILSILIILSNIGFSTGGQVTDGQGRRNLATEPLVPVMPTPRIKYAGRSVLERIEEICGRPVT
jgi:hypothetical protein